MKEPRPRCTDSDHEHVERMSSRTATLLAALAAVLPHMLQ
jgi:hypothetical protein